MLCLSAGNAVLHPSIDSFLEQLADGQTTLEDLANLEGFDL